MIFRDAWIRGCAKGPSAHIFRRTVRIIILFLTLFLLAGCGGRVPSPREAAEQFLARLKEGKTADAYDSAASTFKLTRSRKYFEARVRDLGLGETKSVTLGEPEARGELMRVRGEFVLNNDTKEVLDFDFVKEGGAWRLIEARQPLSERPGMVEDVFAVEARSSDSKAERSKAFLEPIATPIPPERQVALLVKRSLLDFNTAVKSADFKAFRESVSDRWKYRGKDPQALNYAGTESRSVEDSDPMNKARRITVSALEMTFRPFVEAKVDLSPIADAKMKLDEPLRVNSEGVLIVTGTFDCDVFIGAPAALATRVTFRLEYVFESSTWKLFGLTVNVAKPQLTGK